MNIRIAIPEDAEKIFHIYKYYVDNTTATFEYVCPTVEDFSNKIRNTLIRYPYIVAEEDGEIKGYAYASEFRPRAAYDWCAETTIYIDAECKSKGIGTMLYNELEKYLKMQNILNLNACIAYPNEASENFHKKCGYKKVAHFTKCGFKLGEWVDMIWMEKHIGEHKDNPEKVINFSELNFND